MAEKINLGIIGCGVISDNHLEACKSIDEIEVVAAADLSEGRLQATTEEFGIRRQYHSWQDLVADEDIQGVVLCLPDGVHKEVTIGAARAGKHILVEKPMALNVAECSEMIAASHQARTTLMVAQVMRHFQNHVLAKEWVNEGRIGEVTKIVRKRMMGSEVVDAAAERPWVSKPGLAGDWLLYGFGAHEYDAVLWLLDTQAQAAKAVERETDDTWIGKGWSSIYSTIRLPNNVTADVSLSLCATTPASDTVITGTKGTLAITGEKLILNGEETAIDPNFVFRAFETQLREFAECIRTGKEPGSSGQNVLASMALLEAVTRSLESQGKSVEVGNHELQEQKVEVSA